MDANGEVDNRKVVEEKGVVEGKEKYVEVKGVGNAREEIGMSRTPDKMAKIDMSEAKVGNDKGKKR
jgi:hypothetical protein